MNVTCDQCSKEFVLQKKKKKHPNGVEEIYFTCPHCQARYSSAFTNARARKIQKQIRQLWSEIGGCGSITLAEHKKQKIDQLTAENKMIMDQLKQEHVVKRNEVYP